MEKQYKYAVLIQSQISAMFESESDNHIDPEDLNDSDNCTAFFHALATIAPCSIFNKLTGNDSNHLEFNHLANQLTFQFSKKD